MKKLLLIICVALMGVYSVKAQTGMRLGVNVGFPTGDFSEAVNFQGGADIAYLLTAIPLLEVGPMIGYSRFFIEDSDGFDFDDVHFLPIAASGRLNLALLFVGADLGYAIGLNEGSDGGFYYRPHVGIGLGPIGLIGSYSGISRDGTSLNSINIGIEFGL